MEIEGQCLKAYHVGIIGGILAFVTIALPWWSTDLYVWRCQTALALVLISSFLGIAGGLLGIIKSTKAFGKYLLMGSGALTILSTIIFAATLQYDLAKGLPSYGFWTAIFAAIIMFVALKEIRAAPTPSFLNKIFMLIFIMIAIAAVCASLVYKMTASALILWLSDFLVAFIVAVFGSLRIRSEEEEKMLK